MEYEMQFCVGCYLQEAMRLTQNLLESNPHDKDFSLKLVPGDSGSFDIKKNETVVFSKKTVGRLPTARDLGLSNKDAEQDKNEGQKSAGDCSC